MAHEAADTAPDFVQYQLKEDNPTDNNPIQESPTGLVLQHGEFASPNYVKGVSGWKLDAQGNFECVNGTFSGSLGAVSLNIPDTTTANSYHVDANGNTWWGANLATGYTGANAYVLNTGAAVFKNITMGGSTIQYVITNSGIFSYGDSSDGTATCDGSTAVAGMSLAGSTYTMTRDVNFSSLTINTGVTVVPAGYRLFVANALTLVGTANINRNGPNGSNGSNASIGSSGAGGGGGASLADGYLKGSASSGSGGTGATPGGVPVVGGNGTSVSNSIGTTNGSAGQAGGTSSNVAGGIGGTGGTTTVSNIKLTVGVQLATLLDVTSTGATLKFNNTGTAAGGGGGGGAGGSTSAPGGGGGAGGVNGGILAIYARNIIIGASASITSNGGNGGNGGRAKGDGTIGAGFSGNGGAGAGGNGGIIILVYNSLINSGSLTTTAGTAGIGGGQINTQTDSVKTADTQWTGNGSSGTIYQFQLSL